MVPNESGIGPVRLLTCKSRLINFCKFESDGGMEPFSEFQLMFSLTRICNSPISFGISPVRLL
ncbi:hypothetical protein HanRHA438_Chr04g0166861 [Helianthus annuus]|nr:hypothetical protein HanRHA438_Chr04g0166861 [Helianthus annuus]